MEAVGTTYFNEDAEIAKECVEQTLALYYALCDELDDETKGKTQRAMGDEDGAAQGGVVASGARARRSLT